MHIDIYATYLHAQERRLRERSVVVIDLLRASTSIVEAISNGAKCVIPSSDVEDAIAIRKARGEEGTLLAGERNGLKIDGFTFGNSPLDFTAMAVQSKTIVLTTSNGTNALNHVRNSDIVLIGALRNKLCLCKHLIDLGRDIAIVCAGTDGQFSADDIYCAGAYVACLRALTDDVETTDLGKVAEFYYNGAHKNRALLDSTAHYSYLVSLGLSMDIEYCLEEDVCEISPTLRNGVIEI